MFNLVIRDMTAAPAAPTSRYLVKSRLLICVVTTAMALCSPRSLKVIAHSHSEYL